MSDIWSEDQEDSPRSDVAEAAKQYWEIEQQIEKLTATKKQLAEALKAQFPEDFGTHHISTGGFTITLEIGERWEWDSDILEEIFTSSETLPDYVKKRLTVDKRLYERLNDEQQRIIRPALTRKLGAAKLTVIHE